MVTYPKLVVGQPGFNGGAGAPGATGASGFPGGPGFPGPTGVRGATGELANLLMFVYGRKMGFIPTVALMMP